MKGRTMLDYLLYGIPAGETERHAETLLTCTTDSGRIETVRELATRDGFHSFRQATYDGTAPDFASAIRR
jgi:hypothetical protein